MFAFYFFMRMYSYSYGCSQNYTSEFWKIPLQLHHSALLLFHENMFWRAFGEEAMRATFQRHLLAAGLCFQQLN